MPNPLVLLPAAVGQQPPQLVYGQVSQHQAAPASFADPLYVTIPTWHEDYYWRIDNWPASHGNTLPAQGADVFLAYDDQRNLWCIAWKGAHS